MKLTRIEKPAVLAPVEIARVANNTRSSAYWLRRLNPLRFDQALREKTDRILVEIGDTQASKLRAIPYAAAAGFAEDIEVSVMLDLVGRKNHWEWKDSEIPPNLLGEWRKFKSYLENQEKEACIKILRASDNSYEERPEWFKIHAVDNAVKALRQVVGGLGKKVVAPALAGCGAFLITSLVFSETLFMLSIPLDKMKEVFAKAPADAFVFFVGLPVMTFFLIAKVLYDILRNKKAIYGLGVKMEKAVAGSLQETLAEWKDTLERSMA